MGSKNSLFDRVFFGLISAVIALLCTLLIMALLVILSSKIIGGMVSFGTLAIIAIISLGVALLIGNFLFNILFEKLTRLSLSIMFFKLIKQKQNIVKETPVMKLPDITFNEKVITKQTHSKIVAAKNAKIKNTCISGNFHPRTQHK